MTRERYIPALRFRWLTGIYDPLMARWVTASRMRAAVIEALGLKPGLRLLELGCGPGRLAIEVKRREPQVRVDAVDADPAMLDIARRNAADAGVEIRFSQADITKLHDLGTYDRVYSTFVFHHLMLDGKLAALTSVRRMLRPAGTFVVADFGRPRDRMQWVLSYSLQALDGYANTAPHRDGRFEQALRDTFIRVDSIAAWRTAFGTLEVFVCTS